MIPVAQRDRGEEVAAVTDRLQRFELTAHFRKICPAGMTSVVHRYLEQEKLPSESLLVEDLLVHPLSYQDGYLDIPPPSRTLL